MRSPYKVRREFTNSLHSVEVFKCIKVILNIVIVLKSNSCQFCLNIASKLSTDPRKNKALILFFGIGYATTYYRGIKKMSQENMLKLVTKEHKKKVYTKKQLKYLDVASKSGWSYLVTKNLFRDGSCNYFDLEEFKAVSYNWWTYLCKINGKVVFNDYNYSSTTNKHQASMRCLLEVLNIKVDIWVDISQSLNELSFKEYALNSVYHKKFNLEFKLTTKIRPETIKSVKSDLKECEKQITLLKKMKCKHSNLVEMKKEVFENLTEQRIRAKIKSAKKLENLKSVIKPETYSQLVSVAEITSI